MSLLLTVLVVVVLVILLILGLAVRIVKQYEQGVLLPLGRVRARGHPGSG